MPIPGPSAGRPLENDELDSTLSALAQQDVTEHSEVYEQLLQTLQAELNSSERNL